MRSSGEASGGGKRIAYLDAAKGVGILMIMYGHVTSLPNPVDTWMSSFKVTIFYILTGMVYYYTKAPQKRSFSQFAQRVLKAQLIPYMCFSLLGILYKCARVFLKHRGPTAVFNTFTKYFADTLFLRGINSLWFLPTMIIGVLVFYGLVHSHKIIKIAFGFLGVFAILLTKMAIGAIGEGFGEQSAVYMVLSRLMSAVGKGLMAAWFIGAGHVLCHAYSVIAKNNYIKASLGILLTVVNVFMASLNPQVDINMLSEGVHPVLFYAGGIVGSFGLILLLDVLVSLVDITWLCYLGINSLILMATHTVFGIKDIAFCGWKEVVHIPDHAGIEYYCDCLAVLVIMLAIEYAVIELVNRRLPFLLGRRARRRPLL